MTTETQLIAALTQALAPVPVWRLFAPQHTDEQPIQTPYVLVSRELFDDQQFSGFCAADVGMQGSYIVDCLHHDYAGARSLAYKVANVFKANGGAMNSLFEERDPGMRVFRVTGSFDLWEDDALAAPQPGP